MKLLHQIGVLATKQLYLLRIACFIVDPYNAHTYMISTNKF